MRPTRRAATRARAPWRRTTATVVAVALLVGAPLVPGALASGSPSALLRIPVESLIVVLLLALLPWRVARRVVAALYGTVVVAALLLAGIDTGYESVLDRHFDPSDWQQLGDAFGVVADSVGRVPAALLVALIALVTVALVVALAWAALRTHAAIRRHDVRGTAIATTVTAAWVVAALAGSQLVAGEPAAAASSVDAIASAAGRLNDTARAQANLAERVRDDPYAAVPASELLTRLKGKDVVFAFIESYGQVAVQGTSFSDGVARVLKDGDAQLSADGYRAQSAWLTSPTFGGVSWLAHSTLQTGLWVDSQSLYDKVIRTKRLTLSDAFGDAGWKTVSDIPSDPQPWSFGTSFYHYDTLLDATNVGYHGPSFGYARIPDQYTWQSFQNKELAGPHQPVMAEIDFVSSHTPWAPLPKLVPWSQLGDGTVYAPQPGESASTDEVWKSPASVQKNYGESVQYSLGALFSFLHTFDDPNLVVVALGDHQPATIVSGAGANHDVPISIISKDPAVFQDIKGWRWQDGVLPTKAAPLWRMDAFRDRFLSAYGRKDQ